MAGFRPLTHEELHSLVLPDLTAVYLALPEGFTNGLGEEVSAAEVVRDLLVNTQTLLDLYHIKKRLPVQLFVPDLWHIAKGRALSLPKEEGDQLWEFGILCNRIATTLYGEKEYAAFEHRYPGSVYRTPLDVPNYRHDEE